MSEAGQDQPTQEKQEPKSKTPLSSRRWLEAYPTISQSAKSRNPPAQSDPPAPTNATEPK